jgi:putative membrane protein
MTGIVRLLVAWGINVLALIVVDGVFDSVEIRRWWPVVLGGAVLGVANAVVRPLLTVLTLPFVIVSLGLGYLAISVGMLALAEWVAPDFTIDGFWTYVGATLVISLVNMVFGSLLGVRRKGKVAFPKRNAG